MIYPSLASFEQLGPGRFTKAQDRLKFNELLFSTLQKNKTKTFKMPLPIVRLSPFSSKPRSLRLYITQHKRNWTWKTFRRFHPIWALHNIAGDRCPPESRMRQTVFDPLSVQASRVVVSAIRTLWTRRTKVAQFQSSNCVICVDHTVCVMCGW